MKFPWNMCAIAVGKYSAINAYSRKALFLYRIAAHRDLSFSSVPQVRSPPDLVTEKLVIRHPSNLPFGIKQLCALRELHILCDPLSRQSPLIGSSSKDGIDNRASCTHTNLRPFPIESC